MNRSAWTIANGVMLAAFAFSIVVQFNDPDPLGWVLIYAAAAVACGLELRRRAPWWWPAVVGVVALAWGAGLAPRALGSVPFLSMFDAFEMKDVAIEESREMYGLWMIAAWMAAIAVAALRRRQSAQRAE
jgi:hypothetical protein